PRSRIAHSCAGFDVIPVFVMKSESVKSCTSATGRHVQQPTGFARLARALFDVWVIVWLIIAMVTGLLSVAGLAHDAVAYLKLCGEPFHQPVNEYAQALGHMTVVGI
nr:hypothetical protein [Tanacetum cinerariifolium]